MAMHDLTLFPLESATLTKALGVGVLRAKKGGIHGAGIDSRQTTLVVAELRQNGLALNHNY